LIGHYETIVMLSSPRAISSRVCRRRKKCGIEHLER